MAPPRHVNSPHVFQSISIFFFFFATNDSRSLIVIAAAHYPPVFSPGREKKSQRLLAEQVLQVATNEVHHVIELRILHAEEVQEQQYLSGILIYIYKY